MEKLKSASVIVKNIIALVENAITNKDYRYLDIKKNIIIIVETIEEKMTNNQQPLGINYNNWS